MVVVVMMVTFFRQRWRWQWRCRGGDDDDGGNGDDENDDKCDDVDDFVGERLLYWTRWVYWTTPIFLSLLTWSAPINISTSDVVSVTKKNSIKMDEKDKILSRGLKIEISLN